MKEANTNFFLYFFVTKIKRTADSCQLFIKWQKQTWLLYLQPHIRFLIGECVLSKLTFIRRTKLTKSLGKIELLCILKPRPILCQLATSKQFISLFYVWVRRYDKTLNDWPHGKQWVLFPRDPKVLIVSLWGTVRVSGKQKLTVSLGAICYM